MRFLLLTTIIISSLALNACGKTKKLPQEEVLNTSSLSSPTANSAGSQQNQGESSATHSRQPELTQSAMNRFDYLNANELRSLPEESFKNRLELGMIEKLKELAFSQIELVFETAIHQEPSGYDVNSSDYSVSDGQHWFVGISEDGASAEANSPGIDIWSLNGRSGSARHLTTAYLTDHRALGNIAAIELVGSSGSQQLMIRRTASSQLIGGDVILEKPSLPSPRNGSMLFQWVDVASVTKQSEFTPRQSLTIGGQFISSRRQGNTLYVVSGFTAWKYGANPFSEEVEFSDETPLQDYLPSYRASGQDAQVLSNDCLIAGEIPSVNLINITAIDMVSGKLLSNRCINGDMSGAYLTEEGVYLGFERKSDSGRVQTDIHQFSLGVDSIGFRASGAIPGVVNWGNNSFGLKVLNGNLYVVSTQRDADWNPIHGVYRTMNSGEQLRFLSVQGNQAALLGHSELAEARFVGNRAYLLAAEEGVSTAVIELDSEQGPVFLGELMVGNSISSTNKVSRWLSVGSEYILQIIDILDEDQMSNGVDITLLNVKVVEEPRIVSTISFSGLGTSTEAAYDLNNIDIYRGQSGSMHIALPLSVYSNDMSVSWWQNWDYNGVAVLEVQASGGEASLTSLGALKVSTHKNAEYEDRYMFSRSLLIGDSVFNYYNMQVYGSLKSAL